VTTAGLLPFAFFAACAAMSIPAGLLIATHGEKRIITVSFIATDNWTFRRLFRIALENDAPLLLSDGLLALASGHLLSSQTGSENSQKSNAILHLLACFTWFALLRYSQRIIRLEC
jgi:MFS family permease